MKRVVTIGLVICVAAISLIWTAGVSSASCPAGKAGRMLAEDTGDNVEFQWTANFVADPPEGGTVKVNLAFLPFIGQGGNLTFNDNSSSFFAIQIDNTGETNGLPYAVDRWNNLTATFDFDAQTVDLKINDESAQDIAFYNTAADLRSVYPQYFETTEELRIGWIDSLKVTVTGQPAPVYSENFETVEPVAGGQNGEMSSVTPPNLNSAAGANCPSQITLNTGRTATKLKASGEVTPAHTDGDVVVKLFKRKNGSFVLVDKKDAPLDGLSEYSATFTRPSAEDCKITAKFPGDEDHRSSTKSKQVNC